ncbi:hypothetical protein [Hippea sp. KM1]|uniref:hypothetical protein n=1 Tax=Hippea sp. KM1 TaxID=944481 RepID=UPI00046D5CC4|nr:hypothetical protein [Hippea sp. KM1]
MNGSNSMDDYIRRGRALAWLAYLGLLIIIPAALQKDNPYTVYHVKQGLALLICSILASFLWFVPLIGVILGWVASVVLFVLNIIGIYNAASGKIKPLPIIGALGEGFNF